MVACLAVAAPAQDDVADVPSEKRIADKDEKKSCFEIGPLKDDAAPAGGFGLVIVMPGGNGSAEFNPFVRRIYKRTL